MINYLSPEITKIDDAVSEIWHIDRDLLYTPCRWREVSEARQLAIFLRMKYQGMTSQNAARIYNRDHATALWACDQVRTLSRNNKDYKRKFEAVIEKMGIFLKKSNRNKEQYVSCDLLDNVSIYR